MSPQITLVDQIIVNQSRRVNHFHGRCKTDSIESRHPDRLRTNLSQTSKQHQQPRTNLLAAESSDMIAEVTHQTMRRPKLLTENLE